MLFPGQGSQVAGMRDAVERHCPHLLEQAIAELGEDPYEHLSEGTHNLQPAVYCASVAGWRRLEDAEPEICAPPALRFVAGHSLGEVAALVAAGALDEAEGLRLVILRGRLMRRAAQEGGAGGMLAMSGGAEFAVPLAERLGLTLANDNARDQVVLSGPADALDQARREARAAGCKALKLPIEGAFHSPAMTSVTDAFARGLRQFRFDAPRVPVISCVTAEPFDDPRRRLVESLVRGVRWRDVLALMRDGGVVRFVEAGPGKVLCGLVRRNLEGATAETVDDLEAVGA